jgi:hypothetical protein
LTLTDLDDPAKSIALAYTPVELGGFGALELEIRAHGLAVNESFLTLAGDGLDDYLIDVVPSSSGLRPAPEWETLTGRLKLRVNRGPYGYELHLELSPDRNPSYWMVQTSLRVPDESVENFAVGLRRLLAEQPGKREPPTLPAVGVHPVMADEALALAAEAKRLDWPVFRIDGPSTERELLQAVLSVFPLDPPTHTKSDRNINWDALDDSLTGGIDGLNTSDVLIWWQEAGRLAPARDALLRSTRSRETYSTLMDVLTDLALSLGDPKYTVDDPTRVTILVSGSLRDVGLPGENLSPTLAPVVFAIGDRPEIPGDDALELAELLNRQGMAQQFETAGYSLTAVTLAAKIQEQAGVFPNGQPLPDDYEKSQEDIAPGEYELAVLSEFLASEPWPRSRPWFEHFQYEVNRQLGRASD